jgi:thiaminase (transcriptional activator TenA)
VATDLAGVLWSANQDLAEACLSHPFVRGLATGSLPLDSFRQYEAQDSFFPRGFRPRVRKRFGPRP